MRIGRAIAAGLAGTAVMTMLMLMAPLMGMPRMAIGEMLGGFLGIGAATGWAMHAVIGVLLAGIYAILFDGRFPGQPVVRGMIFGAGVFLLAQLAVMPMMGAGVFSDGNVAMIMGSLLGHLVYGAMVGAIFGAGSPLRASFHA